jgi:hypothetical protein
MQIKTDNCGGQGGKRSVSRKETRGEGREEGRKEGRERKSVNVAKWSLMRSAWEDGTVKKMVESLCLWLRDGLHQKVAGQRWLLCDGRFVMIIPI